MINYYKNVRIQSAEVIYYRTRAKCARWLPCNARFQSKIGEVEHNYTNIKNINHTKTCLSPTFCYLTTIFIYFQQRQT